MVQSFKRSFFIFLAILLLPTLIFSIYEIGTLRENEKVIEDVYNNQLDAILFSVNQYSDDALNNWAIKLNQLFEDTTRNKNAALTNYLNELPAIKMIFRYDLNKNLLICAPDNDMKAQEYSVNIRKIIVENDSTIKKLGNYLKSGYRKIVSFKEAYNGLRLILFLSESTNGVVINVLLLDPDNFINQVLDPKIQEITQNKFYIVAYNPENKLIYSSDKQHQPDTVAFKKPFWLLNHYSLGIEFKDQTINDLAKSRSKRNVALMIFIDAILFLGIWLIYRNVRKQVELSQLKSDFVSNVSHEIRTPLALISMYIETLDMGRVSKQEKIKEYYGIILQETQRLSAIVNKILSFSQIESGKRKYSFSEVDVNKLVCDVAATYKISLENKGFKFSADCSKKLPLVMADPEALNDALVNLIDNAIKYSAENKQLDIRTGMQKNMVFIEVEDKGIGISQSDQKYIFDKFYRVTEKNLAHKAKGSGLGLSIVKHMMDAHGGKIIVVSEPGKGSCFRLVLNTANINKNS
jgi:two-component system phosphate regulon sensor histidine kinase PhoR